MSACLLLIRKKQAFQSYWALKKCRFVNVFLTAHISNYFGLNLKCNLQTKIVNENHVCLLKAKLSFCCCLTKLFQHSCYGM